MLQPHDYDCRTTAGKEGGTVFIGGLRWEYHKIRWW